MLTVDKVVDSVSITHKFDKPVLSFLNTSDIENGRIVKINRLPIEKLKGQAKKTR
jgi:type I restriction enzyme S subunit